tara:strand:+ start:406 stop:1098 length:693 start_codon:yes stop_codon:yes gene_type:complete
MNITWLGHSGFRIAIGNQTLILDPWFFGNPLFPETQYHNAIKGATHCLISHGHDDHAKDAIRVAEDLKIPLVGIYDLVSFVQENYNVNVIGFNKGGTVKLGNVNITMVSASHSSSFKSTSGATYSGTEVGFMIEYMNRTIYFSGDTDIMADMALFEELHHPEIGILSAGGHFTMSMKRASLAASKFFNFQTLIPCHYKTFPVLEQSAKQLKLELPNVNVIEPEVLKTIKL